MTDIAKKHPGGRPRKNFDATLPVLHLPAYHKAGINRAAKKSGRKRADWIRETLVAAARKAGVNMDLK